MGIEIRPAAVIAMLDEKSQKFDVMKETFSRSKQAMRQFIDDDTLRGEAYSAAKERFWYNLQAIEAFELSIDRSKQIDSQFKSIIEGTWGAMAEVSEDYWVNERVKVIKKIRYFQNKGEQAQKRADADPTNFVDRARAPYYQMQVEAYKNALRIPDEMIRKIHDYCRQTDGLYNDADLNALDESLNRAISAFDSATFNHETKTWEKMDKSCFEGLSKSVKKVQNKYYLELSKKEDSWALSDQFAYIQGKIYDLTDDEAFQFVLAFLTSDDMWKKFAEEAGKSSEELLREVGIAKIGKMSREGEYCIFSGFEMLTGAQRMTTRCRIDNIKNLIRPAASQKASNLAKFSNVSKGVGRACVGITIATGVFSAGSTYVSEYEAGEGLSEGKRRSNANVATGIDIAKTGASVAAGTGGFYAGMAFGAAIGSVFPGVGTVVGAVAGGLIGALASVATEELIDITMSSDVDNNGKSLKQDIQDFVCAN